MVYYTIENLNDYLKLFNIKKIKCVSKKKIKYYNIPCTFDIETTSAYKDLETGEILQSDVVAEMKENNPKFNDKRYKKLCWMYIWQMSIDDHIIIGRTWKEYLSVMNAINKHFELDKKRLMIFVRNLAFEFQFIKKLFNWEKIFATEAHKIIYGITTNNFEFRCSYFLSGCSLETTGKNLIKYKAEKKTGDLDYNLIRTSATPLTEKEIGYCLYDVIVDSNFIRESMEMEKKGSLLKIPLTKTGYVRRYCKEYCLSKTSSFEYRKIITQFTLNEDLYAMLKSAFAGGFTHSNAVNTGLVFKNVFSHDFTSSYPAVMCLEKFPMGRGYEIKIKSMEHLAYYLKNYCCLFEVTFKNIRQKDNVFENIISESKCIEKSNVVVNNGRVVSADSIKLVINEVDFSCIRAFYNYESLNIGRFIKYKKGYLPSTFIKCILGLYADKTTLKDVIGKEVEYQLKKGMLNSCYGMCVTDPLHEEVIYDEDNNEWSSDIEDMEKACESYDKSKSRFIAYEWGIWTTSYARRNLFTAVLELKEDYIYSDTDSVKYINYENHKAYFERYNNRVFEKIKEVCEYYKGIITEEMFSPKTIKGKVKTIGLWDFDAHYNSFKTLGAKRYLVEYAEDDEHYNKENPYSLTVSGLNKKKALPYLLEKSKKLGLSIFELFDDDMFVSGKYTGKQCVAYIEEEMDENITDYLGNITNVKNYSGTHLENSPYSLSLSQQYIEYINKLQTKYKKVI